MVEVPLQVEVKIGFWGFGGFEVWFRIFSP
jgi:hypothetical protein